MRRVSWRAHRGLIVPPDPAVMELVDPWLPAGAELVGPHACAVLDPAVAAAGGVLHGARCVQVHYVPGTELVAQYRVDVTWANGRRRRDTLLAATSVRGVLAGAVPVVAELDGSPVEVSVWRWPYDPVLPALAAATSADELADRLCPLLAPPLAIEVVAYRPTERAVLRVRDATGRAVYLKVVRPGAEVRLARRHEVLREVGLPVPQVLGTTPDGLLVLSELAGTTWRERIKLGLAPWPSAAAVADVLERVGAAVGLDGSARGSRTQDALAHLDLLDRVFDAGDLSTTLRAVLAAGLDDVATRSGPCIHGDLHEGQLVVGDDGSITGVLDIDDVGGGDPFDDPATLLGHLRYRASTATDARVATPLRRAVAELRTAFIGRYDEVALDRTTAAVLVGLATGPFRLQQREWEQTTRTVLRAAVSLTGSSR